MSLSPTSEVNKHAHPLSEYSIIGLLRWQMTTECKSVKKKKPVNSYAQQSNSKQFNICPLLESNELELSLIAKKSK